MAPKDPTMGVTKSPHAFPSKLYHNYSVVGDGNDAWSRLVSLKVFIPATREPSIDLFDVIVTDTRETESCQRTFTNAKELGDYINSNPIIGGMRYLSINQKDSWSSLEICQSMLKTIMRKHNIMLEFLEIVRSFQDKKSNLGEAFGGTLWKRCTPHSKEIALVLKYPEENGRGEGADPWSIRQTGIYQRFESETKTSLWILLHPKQQTAADSRIKNLLNASAKDGFLEFMEQPSLVGLITLSTYFVNWRAYMAFYEKEELLLSRVVSSAVINKKLHFSHATLSKLRHIEVRLLALPSIFDSLLRVIQMLEEYYDAFRLDGNITDETHHATSEVLRNFRTLIEAYDKHTTFLLEKVRTTAQLLSDTLNLKHQQTAEHTSDNTLALTNAAVQDSATIRVITVVTLLYLPAMFIATLFGMQFFATDAAGSTVSSRQLWIFFALAAPFTAITFGYWKWMDRKQRNEARLQKEQID